MAAIILDGGSLTAHAERSLCSEVESQLAAQFETVRSVHLAGYDIGHCMGEFDCFVKTPGRCRIHDEGQEIERAVHDAELVVLLTPARLAAVLNGGFPEPEHFRFVFGLLGEFAREAGYTWVGGLAVGGGEAIAGRSLDRVGGLARPLRRALDLGVPALLAGGVLPEAACQAAARGLPPDRLFEERFVSPRRGALSDQAQTAVFESADGEQTITLRPGDTLLKAALNAGIALPFSCCAGGCGACLVHITDHLDHVVLDEPNAVKPEARSRSEVPACLVRLTSPCRFRLP